jgi:hypothetical protein
VRIRITIDISDEVRRALAKRIGRRGLATRADVRHLVEMSLQHEITDALAELAGQDMRTAVSGH